MGEEKTYHLFKIAIYKRVSHDSWTNLLVTEDMLVVGTDIKSVFDSVTGSFEEQLMFIGSIKIERTNIAVF